MTWSDPEVLRGLEENVVYFVTFSDGSSDVTLNAGNANFLPLTNITPGVNYSIEVRMLMYIHKITMYMYDTYYVCVYMLHTYTSALSVMGVVNCKICSVCGFQAERGVQDGTKFSAHKNY